jgi:hypothetical protein
MFPSLVILQHYVEFNIRTIITLEKLLGVGSFGGYIGHLARCRTTILTSSSMLFEVPTIAFAFLECWALIVPTFVTHFQQDDRLILFDAVAHVETGISPF